MRLAWPNLGMLKHMSYQTIGILGAMTEEIEQLLADMHNPQTEEHHGFRFYRGVLHGQAVVLAECGIGKVNAALTTALLLSLGVDALIFTGVAGGVAHGLKIGDIVVSSDLLQHDVDVTPLGYPLGQVPGEPISWASDAQLQRIAIQAAQSLAEGQVHVGRIVSGDQFIASPEKVEQLSQQYQAVCVEMEGAAVAQVASKWGVPFVVIRSLSDTSDDDAKISYREFMPIVARRAKAVVRAMLEQL